MAALQATVAALQADLASRPAAKTADEKRATVADAFLTGLRRKSVALYATESIKRADELRTVKRRFNAAAAKHAEELAAATELSEARAHARADEVAAAHREKEKRRRGDAGAASAAFEARIAEAERESAGLRRAAAGWKARKLKADTDSKCVIDVLTAKVQRLEKRPQPDPDAALLAKLRQTEDKLSARERQAKEYHERLVVAARQEKLLKAAEEGYKGALQKVKALERDVVSKDRTVEQRLRQARAHIETAIAASDGERTARQEDDKRAGLPARARQAAAGDARVAKWREAVRRAVVSDVVVVRGGGQ